MKIGIRDIFVKIMKVLMIVFILQNCIKHDNYRVKNTNNIIIELKSKNDNNIAVNDLYNVMYMISLNEKFPKYYKTQLNYKGINNKGSVVISTFNTNRKSFYYDLFKQRYIDEEDYVNMNLDSLKEKVKPKQVQLLVAIIFEDEKQKLIVDENNNKDFSDDRIIKFDKKFRIEANDSSIIENLPQYNFNYWNIKNEQIINLKRKIIIYPSLNDIHFKQSNNDTIKNSRLIIDFKDYWEGKFNVDNVGYEIAVHGVFNSFLSILIKPDSLEFSKNNSYYNENFAYKINDTIEMSNKLFVIDSINNNISKIFKKKSRKKIAFLVIEWGKN